MELTSEPLDGELVRLEPVDRTMREEVRLALDVDPGNWLIQFVNGRAQGFESYWTSMLQGVSEGSRIAFAVRLRSTGKIIGTSSYHHISCANRSVEIGSTFLRPAARGTGVNEEMKLMMLDYAFARGALRVQFTVDSRNKVSRAAVAKLGAICEGVLRRHLVTWTGHLRDSVVFSIIDTEWHTVRKGLVERLNRRGLSIYLEPSVMIAPTEGLPAGPAGAGGLGLLQSGSRSRQLVDREVAGLDRRGASSAALTRTSA